MKKTRQTYANQTYARQTYAGQRKSILTVCSGCRTLEPSVNTFLCLEWKSLCWIPCVWTGTGLEDAGLQYGSGQRTGMVHFYSDSDSLLVRGVLSILEELYQARTPEIIKSHPMRFLDYISDDVIYPEIKENGLSKCYQILARM